MQNLQEDVALFLQLHALEHDAAMHVLDLVSEVGELAKLVLEATDYGREPLNVDDSFADEIGDAAYSLLALAAALDIDVDGALRASLEKYEMRIRESGRPGSRR